jgi:hypothetical protein
VVVACFKVKCVLLPGGNEMTKRNLLVEIRIRGVKLSHVMFDDIRKEVKGKAVPLQARSGPGGSRKLRFPDYMPTAQDGGKVVSLTHRPPLPPENAPGTHFS